MAIDWKSFEEALGPLYSAEGRPALPIRRMAGLMMLKHLQNLSDERVVVGSVRKLQQKGEVMVVSWD